MTKYICKNCGKVFSSFEEKEEKIRCPRCKSKEIYNYNRRIKIYYECLSCKKLFKIPERSAITLFQRHEAVSCPYCKSKTVIIAKKYEYKKFSGQLQKKHETQMITLFEYNCKMGE